MRTDAFRRRNIEKLQEINNNKITQSGQGTVVLRAPTNAVPLRLLTQAEQAAPCKDLRIEVTRIGHQTRAVLPLGRVALESRVWDPSD